ncbi:hypothetical protein PVL29_022100 [Vitis rotundifolia]|uniref:Uncharacterized protein n=1 Tax=Vitis rotundifolia TaxID=103349 RepID=A0AA38YUJ1_VITRO|nr:hypothetical protein PVL29_022100 [Vitis rotundifolia]
MVRPWKGVVTGGGGGGSDGLGGACLVFWLALVALSLISAVIFSCADGASKDKASASDTGVYGAGCTAECGAACGA